MKQGAQPTREEQGRTYEEEKRKALMASKTLSMSGEKNALDVTVTAGKKERVVRDYEGKSVPVFQFNEQGAYARTYSYTDRRGRRIECMTEYFIGTPRNLAPESTVFLNHETFPAYLHSIMVLCLSEIDAGRLRQMKIGDDIRSCVTIALDRYLALQGLEGCDPHTRTEARNKLLSYALELAQVGCHKVEYMQADGDWKAFRWTFAVAVSSATWDSETEELTCVMESTFLEIFRKPGGDDARHVTSRPVPAALVKVDRDSLEHAVYRYLIQQYTNNGMVRKGRHTHVRFSSLQEWLIENTYIEKPHKGDSASFRTKYQAIIKALDRLERDVDTFSYTFLREDTLEELDLAYTALPDKEAGYKGGLIYSPGRKAKEVARTLDRCVIEVAMEELDPYAESVRKGWKKKTRRGKAKAAPAKKKQG